MFNPFSTRTKLANKYFLRIHPKIMFAKPCPDKINVMSILFNLDYIVILHSQVYHLLPVDDTHLSKGTSDLKQKCTQLLIPYFLGTVFMLFHIHFDRSDRSRNHFLIG